MPIMVKVPLLPSALNIRSKYGNANWQTGQLTLKKAATTGPRLRAPLSENLRPSGRDRAISGAGTPVSSAGILPSRRPIVNKINTFNVTREEGAHDFPDQRR